MEEFSEYEVLEADTRPETEEAVDMEGDLSAIEALNEKLPDDTDVTALEPLLNGEEQSMLLEDKPVMDDSEDAREIDIISLLGCVRDAWH